jgi:hypothetical protein
MRIGVLEPAAREQVVASISAVMTAWLASPFLPLSSMTRAAPPSRSGPKPGRVLGVKPASSTVKGMADEMPRASIARAASIQASKSSRPWPGAVCTKPVPASSVT